MSQASSCVLSPQECWSPFTSKLLDCRHPSISFCSTSFAPRALQIQAASRCQTSPAPGPPHLPSPVLPSRASSGHSVGCTLLSPVLSSGEGNGTPLQYSCLENPMEGGAWKAAVHGVAEGRTRLSDFTFTFHFHALGKEMATHSSVLAWRIPGTGKPGGLPSMGSHRVRHD